ncbi:MAG: hypothetical protein M1838_001728 [Thelocarpon superellum]|nr:MAG: hypothetical protein M1838_001728 [Thelocarpon superellum]
MDHQSLCAIFFLLVLFYRYVRLLLLVVGYSHYRPIPCPEKPTLLPKDVTVIIPTINGVGDAFVECLRSIAASNPFAIYIATVDWELVRLQRLAKELGFGNVRVLSIDCASKRLQLSHAVKSVSTKITVFADDDVYWPEGYLTKVLAPLEDPEVGGAGSLQRAVRTGTPNMWNALSAFYLARRMFWVCATQFLDGGITTLAGRTQIIRTSILDDDFITSFQNDLWIGRYPLARVDDDKFITRWLFTHGWKIKIQSDPSAAMTTNLHTDSRFLGQCFRWARTSWRGNFTTLLQDWQILREQPFSFYITYLRTLQPPTVLYDFVLLYSLWYATESWTMVNRSTAVTYLVVWMIIAKAIKLIPHFCNFPRDIYYLPASIIFGYLHGFINVYALFTTYQLNWGSIAKPEVIKTE